MKLTKLVAVLLLSGLVSCAGVATASAVPRYTAQGSTGFPTPYAMEAIKAATYLVRTEKGTGSGVAYRDTGLSTLILTAAHVVDHLKIGESCEVLGVTIGGGHRALTAYLVKIGNAENIDLAILSTNPGLDLVPLDSRLSGDLPTGTPAIAVGCPARIFPPVLSVGYLIDSQGVYTYHTAGVWFGSSGGPLLAADTLSLIGINVRIGSCPEGGPHSDRVLAMRIEFIRSFVKDSQ